MFVYGKDPSLDSRLTFGWWLMLKEWYLSLSIDQSLNRLVDQSLSFSVTQSLRLSVAVAVTVSVVVSQGTPPKSCTK